MPKQDAHFTVAEDKAMIMVFGQHKYYKNLTVDLFEAQLTQNGKVKNPLNPLNPRDLIWKTENSDTLKFFTAISELKNNYSNDPVESDIEALKALVKNPLEMSIFYHNTEVSENITAASIVPVQLSTLSIDLQLSVHAKDNFYEVTENLAIGDKAYPLG